jgi:hypothetical protein
MNDESQPELAELLRDAQLHAQAQHADDYILIDYLMDARQMLDDLTS